MNVYQLDDKAMDVDFLNGKVVTCRAVLPLQGEKPVVEPDESIVIMLSNGKKFKGRVIQFIYFALQDHAVGELKITKYN